MKAEDLLSEDQNSIKIEGQEIRKGSIGAFMINCKIILDNKIDSLEYKNAIEDVKAQAPLLKNIGFFEIFELKSMKIKDLIS